MASQKFNEKKYDFVFSLFLCGLNPPKKINQNFTFSKTTDDGSILNYVHFIMLKKIIGIEISLGFDSLGVTCHVPKITYTPTH